MVMDSLRRVFLLLARSPLLWLPGIVAGGLGAMDILLQFTYGTFFASRVVIIEALIMPFLLAGAYTEIKTGDKDLKAFLSAGIHNYFRILLPTLLITCAILATVILLSIPLAIMGVIETVLPFILLGSIIPIIFFVFFYDTAAVFEDRGVFDCIRRSVEVVLNRPARVIGFFLACLGIVFIIALPLAVIWTGLLYDQLLPLSTMDPSQIQSFSMSMLNGMLGSWGIQLTSVFYFIGVAIVTNIIYAFKAVFFQTTTGDAQETEPPVLHGEYDEKGRWYKY